MNSVTLFNSSVWQHKHVLDVEDFSTAEIEMVMQITQSMKDTLSGPSKKQTSLRGKTVVTLFFEASTRTRGSFEMASKNLGADVINITVQSSSISKGESLLNTLKTLESIGADIIVMRHPLSGAHYSVAPYLKAKLINAGDGWHAHPTQALLDLYTMRQHLGEMKDRKVVIIGDIRHSRVAHSNIWCLNKMGARIVLCAPPTLLPVGLNNPKSIFPQVTAENNIEKALIDADVIMELRLQKERMAQGLLPSVEEFAHCYQLNAARLLLAKPQTIIMHPGPVNEDIEMTSEVLRNTKSVVEEQVANGVAVRMAILKILSESMKE